MLRQFVGKVLNNRLARPRMVICAPSGITEVERRAVEEATLSAGAREAHLIEESLAAAIGAGIDIGEPVGRMVVDIGGGTSEVAIISLRATPNRAKRAAPSVSTAAVSRNAPTKIRARPIPLFLTSDPLPCERVPFGEFAWCCCERVGEDVAAGAVGDEIERLGRLPGRAPRQCSRRPDWRSAPGGSPAMR